MNLNLTRLRGAEPLSNIQITMLVNFALGSPWDAQRIDPVTGETLATFKMANITRASLRKRRLIEPDPDCGANFYRISRAGRRALASLVIGRTS